MYHGNWVKPKSIIEKKWTQTPYIYNAIVDRDHRIEVEGITAICMGHDYQYPPLAHPYLGS